MTAGKFEAYCKHTNGEDASALESADAAPFFCSNHCYEHLGSGTHADPRRRTPAHAIRINSQKRNPYQLRTPARRMTINPYQRLRTPVTKVTKLHQCFPSRNLLSPFSKEQRLYQQPESDSYNT